MSACLGEVPDRSSALPDLSWKAADAGDDDYSLEMMKTTAERDRGFSMLPRGGFSLRTILFLSQRDRLI